MKQMTCVAMGGPAACMAVIPGATAEETVANAMKHVTEVHPELAEKIKAMSKEDTDKWMAEFKQKFDAAPEMPAA